MNHMKINKGYIAVGLVIAFALFFELAAHADESDEAIFMTFSAPVQIPGHVLPAGSYLFERADRGSEPNVVQVFSSDRTVLYGTFLTVETERLEPTGHTTVTLAEPESGGTPALLKWFYPGRDTGHEFVYSKQAEKELARDHQQTIAVRQAPTANAGTTGAGN
jgi:hypothetical protein